MIAVVVVTFGAFGAGVLVGLAAPAARRLVHRAQLQRVRRLTFVVPRGAICDYCLRAPAECRGVDDVDPLMACGECCDHATEPCSRNAIEADA